MFLLLTNDDLLFRFPNPYVQSILQVLGQHFPLQMGVTSVKSWPVVGQFSSVGSLGSAPEAWLTSEWLESLTAAKGDQTRLLGEKPKLHLVGLEESCCYKYCIIIISEIKYSNVIRL